MNVMYWDDLECYNDYKDVKGTFPYMQIDYISDSVEPYFGFDMLSPQLVASFHIFAGEGLKDMKDEYTQGYVTVGDSTDYQSNERCNDVNGQGYYNCDEPLIGRYITYFSTQNNN